MDIIIKVSDINGVATLRNLLPLLATIKAGILLMRKFSLWFDFDTTEDGFNYGGNIYKDYDLKRPFDSGVKVGQGNKTSLLLQIFKEDISKTNY
jgi:hypothetical protein